MLTRLHANATTTPKVRAELQASSEPVAVLVERYGISETTVRRWRGRTSTEDRSHVRHNLGQATTPLEEAIIVELRTLGGLSLDDITEVMNRCVNPKLSRGSIWRALRRAGVSGPQGRGRPGPDGAAAGPGRFEDAPFGFVHIDLKYLAKLEGKGEYVFVAIERLTRFVWVAVVPSRSAGTIAETMKRFLAAFPGTPHTVLTDNGAEFTDRFGGDTSRRTGWPSGRHAFDRVCAAHGIEHRLTRPYTPKTNGMVERFNRRLGEAIAAVPASATTPATAPPSPTTPSARPSSSISSLPTTAPASDVSAIKHPSTPLPISSKTTPRQARTDYDPTGMPSPSASALARSGR